MKHPVVIIGAGYSGIISLKICLENGLDAICLDKTDNFGGLWRFREHDHHGVASVQRSTIINTSKEMSALSDFPPPAEYANYMHNSKMLSYLDLYVKHFNLSQYVRYGQEVIVVEKSENHSETGEWIVKTRPSGGGEESELRASAVFACIGHHVFPHMPQFPGQSSFKGPIMHSHSFKDYQGLERKKVLVVGVGNSGMDVAVELSNASTKVLLSTRRGAWIIKRVDDHGLPIDFATSRFNAILDHYFPNFMLDQMEKKLNREFDHTLYNLKPRHRYNAQHPSLSDHLPSRIIGGAIVVKGDICRFTENGVTFKGEEEEEYEIDAAVFATGYNISYPFLGDALKTEGNKVQLYKRVFPPQLEHPTLAIIGLIQPIGPIFPVSEIQARWVCQLLTGKSKLPPISQRLEEINDYETRLSARYVNSQRHTIQVDLVPYMDEIASLIGCKPDLATIMFTDPKLYWKLMFGPSVSYQYRLMGPNSWPGARNAIMGVQDRMKKAFATRYPQDLVNYRTWNPIAHLMSHIGILIAVLAALYWIYI